MTIFFAMFVYNSCKLCSGNGKKAFLSGAAVLIITFSMIRIAVEAFQIYYRHFRYFLDIDNWMELYLYTSSIAFVGFGLAADCECPHPWQWEFGAVTLLIAWLSLVLFLKKFPLTGVYVLMFIHILNTILRIILLPILFVISFGLTFYMLFYRPVSELYIVVNTNKFDNLLAFTSFSLLFTTNPEGHIFVTVKLCISVTSRFTKCTALTLIMSPRVS